MKLLEGLELITPKKHYDERGYFLESYSSKRYDQLFVQDNLVYSEKDVLRGLHYQKGPNAQGKLVTCVQGEIFDVAVDMRPESPTYGEYYGVLLTGENNWQLWIPPGFAHGYSVLSYGATVLYKCDALWEPGMEGGFHWDDRTLNIEWGVDKPIVSEKDQELPEWTK
tara:strand:+ start:898 stop:1398 length:501 start_codon:yes stop_codon:yes gene_type:complete